MIISETLVQDGSSVSHISKRNLISKESSVSARLKDDSLVKLLFLSIGKAKM